MRAQRRDGRDARTGARLIGARRAVFTRDSWIELGARHCVGWQQGEWCMATTVTQSTTVQSRTTMRIYVPIGFVRPCHRSRALFEYSVVQLRRYEECQAPHQRIMLIGVRTRFDVEPMCLTCCERNAFRRIRIHFGDVHHLDFRARGNRSPFNRESFVECRRISAFCVGQGPEGRPHPA